MIFELFREDFYLPSGTNTMLARLRIVPPEGEGWRMLAHRSAEVQGEFTANPDNVQLQFTFAPRQDIQLESVLVTIGGTTQAGAAGRAWPYLRVMLLGTGNANANACRVVLGCSFPVARLLVDYARPGMWFSDGEDLLERYPDRIVAW